MLSLVAATLAGVGVGVIALGGGSGDNASGPAADATPLESGKGKRDDGRPREAKTRRGGRKKEPSKPSGEAKAGEESSPGAGDTESRAEIRKAVKDVPTPALDSFTRNAALNVLKSLGYPAARISLSTDREVVHVTIPRRFACGTRPEDVGEISKAIKEVVIFASKVRVNVAGAGPIGPYVRDNCAPLKPPEADGELVYSRSGTGLRGSDELVIESRRWTLAYENGGGALEIYVSKGNELVEPAIQTKERGVGKQTYAGPGTFRVVANGSGQWKVRVYDGT